MGVAENVYYYYYNTVIMLNFEIYREKMDDDFLYFLNYCNICKHSVQGIWYLDEGPHTKYLYIVNGIFLLTAGCKQGRI